MVYVLPFTPHVILTIFIQPTSWVGQPSQQWDPESPAPLCTTKRHWTHHRYDRFLPAWWHGCFLLVGWDEINTYYNDIIEISKHQLRSLHKRCIPPGKDRWLVTKPPFCEWLAIYFHYDDLRCITTNFHSKRSRVYIHSFANDRRGNSREISQKLMTGIYTWGGMKFA